jgi:hypothetical protein
MKSRTLIRSATQAVDGAPLRNVLERICGLVRKRCKSGSVPSANVTKRGTVRDTLNMGFMFQAGHCEKLLEVGVR